MSPDLDAITLWHIALDSAPDDVARAVALLDPEERAQHRRFATADLARAFAMRRAARRVILARTLGCAPPQVTIETGPQGKPSCTGLAFSAAHSAGRAVVAVAHAGPLGVDIERLRPLDLDLMARRVLSIGEQALIEPLDADRRGAALIRLWTAKEAVLKAEGTGLDLDRLPSIEVPALAEAWSPVSAGVQWQVSTSEVEGYAVALAAPRCMPIRRRDAGPLLAAA